MRRPYNWKRNDDITAERLQSMTDAIIELQNQLRRRTQTGGRRAKSQTPPPFYPKSINIDDPDADPKMYKVRLQRG